ncbi:MAG TPA: hypothetical protein VNW47_15670 [Terriglobales bacterium]|jgi:hypothetical protein|nr:hypothetical protein [Terriglobales bacterium]
MGRYKSFWAEGEDMKSSQHRDRAHPIQLAEEIVRIVGDASDCTASTAIQIAQLLLSHRNMELIDLQQGFIRDSVD